VQGTGTTIVGLHPVAGSSPYRIAQASSLLGCDALAIDPSDNIYAASFASNQNPIFGPSGTLVSANASPAWSGPFGEIYSPTAGAFGTASVFESNATNGTIVRQDLKGGTVVSLETIVTGFTPNHGVPGSLLGPSGLTYNPTGDILYVVDGNNNRLVQFQNASSIPANGITIKGSGFSGPQAALARVIFAGSPLNAPISAALMFNGNIVVGNTGDNNMLEFTPQGALVDTKLVDTGVAGAIFGMVATGTSLASEKLYFNDDNTNSVVLLSQ
jgi:sugar lactone lactonase YvrE